MRLAALLLAVPLLAAESADLSFTWITDSDLARLARQRDLRRIDLSNTRITDAGLELLHGLENVEELNLRFAEFVTEDGIAHLQHWKKLESLDLRGTKVTSKVFEPLGRLTALRLLDLSSTQIDDEGFEHLAALTKLERLAIGANRLTGGALASLLLLPSLRELDVGGLQRVDSGLWGLPLTSDNIARLAALTRLRALSLAGATLADRGVDRPGHPEAERSEMPDLSALRALVNLERLDLSRTPITAVGLAQLANLPRLREVRLGLTPKLAAEAFPRQWQVRR